MIGDRASVLVADLEARSVLRNETDVPDPPANYEIRLQRKSDTEVIIKMRGSDGVVRKSAVITLT